MVEQMALLLATKGLQGASFSEVLSAAGAPRGSLYHYFPDGKDQLVNAALDFAAQRAFRVIDTLRGWPAVEVATGFIAAWRTLLERASLEAGCAIMTVTAAAQSDQLQTKVGEIFRAWRAKLAEALRDGGVAPARAEAMAANLLAACEGAVGMARAERALAPFDLMAAEQIALIGMATSQTTAPLRSEP